MGDISCHRAAWSAHVLVDIIARRCRVSNKTVAKNRDEVSEPHFRNSGDSTRTVERGGTVYQQSVGSIRAKPVRETPEVHGADKAGVNLQG